MLTVPDDSIIAIPGCGLLSVKHWGLIAALEKFPKSFESVAQVSILSYEYGESLDEIKTWEALLAFGGGLLDLLEKKRQFAGSRCIFICHSLGGILLKKALNLACARKDYFQAFLDSILGIIFLGTPHNFGTDQKALERYTTIARFADSGKKGCLKPISLASGANDPPGRSQICNLALQFETFQLPIPVLSVYDGKETRVGWFKSKSLTLVDEEFAKTSLPKEQSYQSDFAHADLCRFDMLGNATHRILEFLQGLLKSAKSVSTFPSSEVLFSHISKYSSIAPSWRSSSSTESAIGTLPARILPRCSSNPDFFGRTAELHELDTHLSPQAPIPRHYALCGMGGVGKTELAVQWFYAQTDHFRAMFWIDAAEPAQLASSYAKIALTLQIQPPGQADDLIANREIAKRWFANTDVPWLLIFDNADNINLLADYWPHDGLARHGSVLVTSRDPLASVVSGIITGLDLEPFPETEASEFIRRVTSCDLSEPEKQAALEMARELGCHPLDIVHMGGVIRRRQWSLQQFMESYHTNYPKLRDPKKTLQQFRHGSMLATAWNFADLDAQAVRLLRILSVLSPDRIQESFFVVSSSDTEPSAFFDDTEDFEGAKDALLSSSIIKRNKIRRELSIHRIIAQEARTWLPVEELYISFCDAVHIICRAWPFNDALENRHKTSRWVTCEAVFSHLEHIHKVYQSNEKSWSHKRYSVELVRLFQEGGAYLHERGFSFEGKPYLQSALRLYEKITEKPPDHLEVLSNIYYTLGAIANETNDGAGCLFNNLILLDMRIKTFEVKGTPDVRLAAANSQIGIAYMMIGKLALATEYFKKSIMLFQSLDNFQIDMLGFPAANLGLAYWMQGQLDEADDTFATALREREREFGKMDNISYKTGRILHGHGNVKASKAEVAKKIGETSQYISLMQESRKLHEASLKQLESTLGEYHHRVADLCHKIAGHRILENDHAEAQEYLDRALRIWGSKHWYKNQVARTSFLKGKHLLQMGSEHSHEGLLWIERARNLRSEILKDEESKEPTEEDYDDLIVFWSR
ncbi:hypothetical protein BOTNAR_0359g00150 [Botryotinia narcissicola]|uniref:DUF7779 domain-containing protein n=1 Tax=Botryotinia narcissicola TaxID=278944 RepID=A0A4Z1HRB2_9HELO|nr:hypothetical protein BOTNAR_0359g00150 [Botryotinia narcissicola]